MRYFGFKKRSFGLKTIGWAGSTASALADLFKNGEQGIWLDPSDLKTMFQDVNGSASVTRDGQPEGLILDKSQGIYGNVIFDDKDVDIKNAKWNAGTALSKSKRSFTTESSGGPRIDFNLIVGKTYKIDMVISSNITVGFYGGVLAEAESIPISNSRKITRIFKANGGEFLYIRNAFGGTTTLEYLQVQELKGSHATQETAAARPIYRTDGNLHWSEFDGVDDTLSTKLPSGTYTEIKASRNGVTHKYPVNINGSYTLGDLTQTKQSVSGLVLVNRQLTQAEIENVTNLMKAKAGLTL